MFSRDFNFGSSRQINKFAALNLLLFNTVYGANFWASLEYVRVCQKIIFQCMYFGLFTFSYNQNSSDLIVLLFHTCDRLCGLVVRVSGYRYRGLGFDSRRYQIF